MKEKLKGLLAVAIVIVLLPYVLTVLFTGTAKSDLDVADKSSTMIWVKYNQVEAKMELEEYLVGVVAKEMSVESEIEALKAQAVVARTNLYKQLEDSQAENIEITFEEPYLSMEELKKMSETEEFTTFYNKLEQAVTDTRGEVITYQDKLIEAPFHAVSAGKTRSGTEVFDQDTYGYLVQVASDADSLSSDYLKIAAYTGADIVTACQETFPELVVDENDLMNQMEILERDSADYITRIKIGNVTMSGEKFRNCLGLNSSCFTIAEYEEGYRITTRGLGHGMGLSQYSANLKAEAGESYRDIINYYFSEVTIIKNY